jgi:hypothetical protein
MSPAEETIGWDKDRGRLESVDIGKIRIIQGAEKLLKNCRKIAEKLPKNCRKIAEKL